MKKFLLLTEYSQLELQNLIEQSLEKVVKEQLQTFQKNPSKTDKNEKLFTRQDLKKILRVSYPTIAKITTEGLLQGKLIGSSYRYREIDVQNYLAAQTKGGAK
jgi:hypothetical protein